jgi:hypothetical protein
MYLQGVREVLGKNNFLEMNSTAMVYRGLISPHKAFQRVFLAQTVTPPVCKSRFFAQKLDSLG